MRTTMKVTLVLMMCLLYFNETATAQYAHRKVSKKQQAYTDSLKNVDYNYIFPILGQQAYNQGFDIPYPVGIMANYMWMEQGIVIDNFQLGIESESVDVPLAPVDFIGFGENINTSWVTTVRPDIWIFPFLNISGIFGYGQSITEVNLVDPIDLKSRVEQGMTVTGFGMMGAFGLGPLWMSIDGSLTWTKPELLEDPVRAGVLGIRLGKSFVFANHPERNVAFWIGGMRARMASNTLGAVSMSDAFPQETWDRVDEIVDDYNTWYDGLDPVRQDIVDNSAFPALIDALDNAEGNTVISYGMDKSPAEEWNMLIGAQFQLNKNWMLRSEAGIIGDRKSFLASLNYRFKL